MSHGSSGSNSNPYQCAGSCAVRAAQWPVYSAAIRAACSVPIPLSSAPVNAAAMLCALEEASFWPARDGRPRFDAPATDAVCFVPATAEAYARRGYDHMELTARKLASMLGLPLADALARRAASDQRDLGRTGRAENPRGTMSAVEDVSGLRLLLVDDVVTTGASIREATRALLRRGAAEVTACSLIRVW